MQFFLTEVVLMRVELRAADAALLSLDAGVFAYPVGVTELTGWLNTLPRPPVRSDRTFLGDCLRARIRVEVLLARCYEAAQSAISEEGTWAGGPSLHSLQRMQNEVLLNARRLRETCADLGEPSDQILRAPELLPLSLTRVIATYGTDVRRGLEATGLAELASRTAWNGLIATLAAHGLGEHAEELASVPAENLSRLSTLRRWLVVAPDPDGPVS